MGAYVNPAWDMGWLNAAKANGLKVVGVLGPNWFYKDQYDPVAMSNLASWIAKTGLVTAFEITNEPNNAYAAYEGPTWQTKLVALTNAVTAAVHAVNPSIQVIGLGGQGTQIFSMLAMGTTMNGVVYHPYANSQYIPETTYEWQYLDYASWIQVLGSRTALPKWETEWGIGTSAPSTIRVKLHFLPGVYCKSLASALNTLSSTNSKITVRSYYGVDTSNPTTPKMAFYVVQRIIATLRVFKADRVCHGQLGGQR